jgi:hypothetical protein
VQQNDGEPLRGALRFTSNTRYCKVLYAISMRFFSHFWLKKRMDIA